MSQNNRVDNNAIAGAADEGDNTPRNFNSTTINIDDVGASEGGGGVVQDGQVQNDSSPSSNSAMQRHLRSWRMWSNMNLNDVLANPSAASIRSLISHSGNFRYATLNNVPTNPNAADNATEATPVTVDNVHVLLGNNPDQEVFRGMVPAPASSGTSRLNARTLRSNSLREGSVIPTLQTSHSAPMGVSVGPHMSIQQQHSHPPLPSLVRLSSLSSNRSQPSAPLNTTANTPDANPAAVGPEPGSPDLDDESNAILEMFVKILRHFVRYLPFICILFVKFIHDHLLGILDLVFLHAVMYHVNKSLRKQVAKAAQKNLFSLVRDLGLIIIVVIYRFIMAGSTPDPFGLLITPSTEIVTVEISSITHNGGMVNVDMDQSSSSADLSKYLLNFSVMPTIAASDATHVEGSGDGTISSNTLNISRSISLGILLYYVAVNDLILKLLTILVKIIIAMLPIRVIRLKSRARLFVLVEYSSQFYRALAPMHQWIMFLFESYTGLEVISGVLFSSFYLGAKLFEFLERGKSLRKAIINFVRNMDYERKPTSEELNAAGTVCPICHDAYNTPVILECNHIFCDECVNTWFKREQTCPMCRAKVSEDPTWQDGSTTYFYQLC